MFYGALNLNTSNVIDMSTMFKGATSFNQPLMFDTYNVSYIGHIFYDTPNLNHKMEWSNFDVNDDSDV